MRDDRWRPGRVGARSVIGQGTQLLDWVRSAWRWSNDPAIRKTVGGINAVLAGALRLIRTNTIKGVMASELALSQRTLNDWFSSFEGPEGIVAMRLDCHPSRLVLELHFDRRLLGFSVGHEVVRLPFEVLETQMDHRGGLIRLRLDRDAMVSEGSLLRPAIARMLAPEAAQLLDGRDPLTELGKSGEAIRREGDELLIDLARVTRYMEFMNRELPLASGRRVFPFRALSVRRIQVKEGRIIALVDFHPELAMPD